ncbi:hypothetical protein E2A64_06425 [Pseudohoeflea suaedae]|uniref:Uncharacterized protein n=1 Tax=Pseudohoeflea suaedae TaxID=877384 RepID=A0A4R5PQ26_9HYPH|nr:hypothetical protein [Pseudohoeflea suaedae]TDH38727.1 hypothetical protein E2A64_06425 [Pseudohoeflea suaedae]
MTNNEDGATALDPTLVQGVASILRRGYDAAFARNLSEGMDRETAKAEALRKVKARLVERIDVMRSTSPDQPEALERAVDAAIMDLVNESNAGPQSKPLQASVSQSGLSNPSERSSEDKSARYDDAEPAGEGGPEAFAAAIPADDRAGSDGDVASCPRPSPGSLALAMLSGVVLVAATILAGNAAGLVQGPFFPRPGVIVIPSERFAEMEAMADQLRDAVLEAQRRFEAGEFGAVMEDGSWHSMKDIHEDIWARLPRDTWRGGRGFIARHVDDGYKILVHGPLCNVISATHPAMVDPVRTPSFNEFCWHFGVWNEAGEKL